MGDVEQCERCGEGATVSVTDGPGRCTLHFCAQHVPGDLSDIVEKENRREHARKQKLSELVGAIRLRIEHKEMEPESKAKLLNTLDSLLRFSER